MGYDAVQGANTFGSGCMVGCARQFEWWREQFQAGSLGCYNPASLGGRSLHAEGRAMDIALNANDAAQRARGDEIFELVVAHPDAFGAQEMLWRGYLWSWQNRHLGKRGPGIQQSDHMNHVHLGIDVHAAKNWTDDWVAGLEIGDDMVTKSELIEVVQAGNRTLMDYIDEENKEQRQRFRQSLDAKLADQLEELERQQEERRAARKAAREQAEKDAAASGVAHASDGAPDEG